MDCVLGAPGAPRAAGLLPTGSPVSTTTFLTRLSPEPQTAIHWCCEPGTLTLGSPLPHFSHFSILSPQSHFPPLACPSSCLTEDLGRCHGQDTCLVMGDSVHSTNLQLCALLGSFAQSRSSFPPPAHFTDAMLEAERGLANTSEETTRSHWSLLGGPNKSPLLPCHILIHLVSD